MVRHYKQKKSPVNAENMMAAVLDVRNNKTAIKTAEKIRSFSNNTDGMAKEK